MKRRHSICLALAKAAAIISAFFLITGVYVWPLGPGAFTFILAFSAGMAAYLWLAHFAADRFFMKRWLVQGFMPNAPYILLLFLALLAADAYLQALPGPARALLCALALVSALASLKQGRRAPGSPQSRPHPVFMSLVFAALLVAYIIYAMNTRFIDSDETRLIFDIKLTATGLTPFSDFSSRAPLIVYTVAAFYRFFSNDLAKYQVLSAVLVWLQMVGLYFLSRRWLSRGWAFLTAVVFGAAPIVLNLLYFKTQTFEMLFVVFSILLFQLSLEGGWQRKKGWLRLGSHALMLLALLSRPSAIVFYAFHFVLARATSEHKVPVKRLLLEALAVGAAFFALTALFFATRNGLFYTTMWKPLSIDIDSMRRLTLTRLYVPLPLLIVTAAGSFSFLKKQAPAWARAAAWTMAALTVAYVGNAFVLGFWPQYYMEFAIPGALLATATLMSLRFPGLHARGFVAILIAVIITSFIPTYASIDRYLGSYTKEGVDQATRLVDALVPPGGTIFGGNPLFALLSDRGQFMDLSHSYYDPAYADKVIAALAKDPPTMIVQDQYIYSSYLWKNSFQDLLKRCYEAPQVMAGVDEDRLWEFDLYARASSCSTSSGSRGSSYTVSM